MAIKHKCTERRSKESQPVLVLFLAQHAHELTNFLVHEEDIPKLSNVT